MLKFLEILKTFKNFLKIIKGLKKFRTFQKIFTTWKYLVCRADFRTFLECFEKLALFRMNF